MLLSYNCSQDRKILAREVFISLLLEICMNFAGEALLILGLKDSVLRPALSGAGGTDPDKRQRLRRDADGAEDLRTAQRPWPTRRRQERNTGSFLLAGSPGQKLHFLN